MIRSKENVSRSDGPFPANHTLTAAAYGLDFGIPCCSPAEMTELVSRGLAAAALPNAAAPAEAALATAAPFCGDDASRCGRVEKYLGGEHDC